MSADAMLRRLWGRRNVLTARDWRHVREFLDGLTDVDDPAHFARITAVLNAAAAVDIAWPRSLRKDGGNLFNERLNALSTALDAYLSDAPAPTDKGEVTR